MEMVCLFPDKGRFELPFKNNVIHNIFFERYRSTIMGYTTLVTRNGNL